MLKDQTIYEKAKIGATSTGALKKFETSYGKIQGTMLITAGEKPADFSVELAADRPFQVFEASFDFADVTVGLGLYTDTMEMPTGVWMTPQTEEHQQLGEEWIEFFVRVLAENLGPQDNFGLPMVTFISEMSEFTVPGNQINA